MKALFKAATAVFARRNVGMLRWDGLVARRRENVTDVVSWI